MRVIALAVTTVALTFAGTAGAVAAPDPFAGSKPALTALPALDGTVFVADDGIEHVITGTPVYPPTDLELNLMTGAVGPLTTPIDSSPDDVGGPCEVVGGGTHLLLARCYGTGTAQFGAAFLGTYANTGWTSIPQLGMYQHLAGGGDSEYNVVGVGDHWLEIGITPHEAIAATSYLSVDSLLTGTIVHRDEAGTNQFGSAGIIGPRTVAALDAPNLGVALCAPTQRTRVPNSAATTGIYDRYQPAVYDTPWVIKQPPPLSSSRPITIQHCGSTTVSTVCNTVCGSFDARGRWLAWPTSAGVNVLDLSTNHTQHIHFPGSQIRVHILRNTLLIAKATTNSGPAVDQGDSLWPESPYAAANFATLRLR